MEDIEKEVRAHGDTYQINAREAVLHLWAAYAAATVERRDIRRRDGVWQAPVLFSFLRQLSQQGWPLTKGVPSQSAKDAREMLRGLRRKPETLCSPCGRGLDKQRAGECSNPLHILSSILALRAHQAWGEVFDQDAKGISPLSHGNPARVGRLRGYGDAINAETAKEFIEAVMEAINQVEVVPAGASYALPSPAAAD